MLKPEASAFSGPKIVPSKPPALHVRWDPAGPSSSLRGTQIAFGGTRWVPALLYVGPYIPFGFYNANLGEGRPHDNHFHCPLAL